MNTVVLITGASTGFGRVASETLARRGYSVFAAMRDSSGRNAANCQALQSLAKREHSRLHVLDLDVTQDASVARAVQQVLDEAGRIDVVINNAGVGALGVTEAYTVQQFQDVFDVNLYGIVQLIVRCCPQCVGNAADC
jgi:NAD(P)-dependent dehydrogenase (short-subunit alcohol dehydrogenase family)